MTVITTQDQYWAALDLGSNSFHFLLVRATGNSFVVVERLKEKVQLLSGFSDGQIHADAQMRGLQCLRRFAQRLQPISRQQIIVMGTHALRQATGASDFVAAAEDILQVPVQIISGQQEAKLIYLGVTYHITRPLDPRLVIDIGGGSTELAFGAGASSACELSIAVGCVALKERYFNMDALRPLGYAEAKQAALKALNENFGSSALNESLAGNRSLNVFGTSGTIESILMVLAANSQAQQQITVEGIAWLEQAIKDKRWVLDAGLPGLSPERTDIFPAGVAILSACFEVLQIQSMQYVPVTLLQGMMGQAVVKDITADLCEDSVDQLAMRFGVDTQQANRVEDCARQLFQQTRSWWQDGDDLQKYDWGRLLAWAARLHEVGMQISPRHYHRHGAYIIKHAELPGFSEHQRSVLSMLVRGHRRSLPGLAFQAYEPEISAKLLRLVALLRLAVILQRSHHDADSPVIEVTTTGDTLHLRCGNGWLASHRMSDKELQVEAGQLVQAGLRLVVGDLA